MAFNSIQKLCIQRKAKKIFKNFLYKICCLKPDWNPEIMIEKIENEIKEKVGNERVICTLSGGVDSSLLSIILNNVCGKNSLSIFVNNGLLRKNEPENIIKFFEKRLTSDMLMHQNCFLKG